MNQETRDKLNELFTEIAKITVSEREATDNLLSPDDRDDAKAFGFKVPKWSVDLGHAVVKFEGKGYFKKNPQADPISAAQPDASKGEMEVE